MKDIKDFMINESSQDIENIKYAMVEVYKDNNPEAYVFDDIDDLDFHYRKYSDTYSGKQVRNIINKVKKLKPLESTIIKEDDNHYDIVTKLN